MKVAALIAGGPKAKGTPATIAEAYCALSTLIGAVTLATAVDDPSIARQIVESAEQTLLPGSKSKARR